MNTGKLFAIVAIGITSLGFTSNASANELSIEQSLTNAIVEQGQKEKKEVHFGASGVCLVNVER